MSADITTHTWHPGDTAVDIKRGQIGEIQELVRFISGMHAWMRPPGGGREWATALQDLRTPGDAAVNDG